MGRIKTAKKGPFLANLKNPYFWAFLKKAYIPINLINLIKYYK